MKEIEVDRVVPRHSVDPDHMVELKECMRKNGWCGRRLLVVNRNSSPDLQDYEALTGTHRSVAAMELRILIPVLVLEQSELPEGFSFDRDHRDYEEMFRKAGLTRAAELMAEEQKLGGKKKYRQPGSKDPRGAGKIRIKRMQ